MIFQVRGSDGKYVAATPIEGTVLVNIGDLMQRWTSDKLTSTVSFFPLNLCRILKIIFYGAADPHFILAFRIYIKHYFAEAQGASS